jgi:cardiolipin synthase
MPSPITIATLVAGYLITLILVRWVVLNKKEHPVSTVAWILAIVLLPYFGGVLYLFFGINRVERRKKDRRKKMKDRLSRDLPSLDRYEIPVPQDFTEPQRQLARLIENCECPGLTAGNSIEVLDDTNIITRRIEEAIIGAQRTIHIEFYIWQPDETGHRLRELMIERARAGVKVRFLYDQIGSMRLKRSYLQPMYDAGIQVASFLPGLSFRERWSFNLRNHRKLVIADGLLGLTGGMNVGDEHLGRDKSFGRWRDTHLQVTGPSVLQLEQVFAEDWYYATQEELTTPNYYPEPKRPGSTIAQVVHGGPDSDDPTFHAVMFAAITLAQHRIRMQTSYFVPTPALVMALSTAALRGVDVQIIVPGKSAHFVTIIAGRSYYDTLLHAGVKIYEYRRGMMHAKTLTIDDNWSLVGSPNFDARSLLLNFELAIASYDAGIVEELNRQFTRDVEHCKEITLAERLKIPRRKLFAENIARLFSPVL